MAVQLDIAYLELERERPDAALAALDAVLDDQPCEVWIDDAARRLRARLRCAAGQVEQALADLRAAISEARDPRAARQRIADDQPYASAHREAALALARERAEQDREFAEHWQRLVESIAA